MQQEPTTEEAKAYDPKEIEPGIYARWEASGYFNPDNLPHAKKKGVKPFGILMPLPNVTGSLHIGHVLDQTIQDILVRHHRMRGYYAYWLPGTDHAGIAAQNVVEKQLKKEGSSRFELGRSAFIERTWQWKNEYGSIIERQERLLGNSCDWSRARFTMDPAYAADVAKIFAHYYDAGLIYRGKRVVNWCARCGTSLSELEIEHKEETIRLVYIRYPLASGEGSITVATTRPETMLGDAAVAVHPGDERYKKLVGQEVIIPLIERRVPIVADRAIDSVFGTGAVKVTPSHDMTDSDIASRHGLPFFDIINERGKMTSLAGPNYENLSVKDARVRVLADLHAAGVIEKEEEYSHNLAACYRCSTPLEPQRSNQWFIRMTGGEKSSGKKKSLTVEKTAPSLRDLAMNAVKFKHVKIVPKNFEKTYTSWLKNIKDWCISRQLWWGHRIPVWYCLHCGQIRVNLDVKSSWFLIRHGETDWNKEQRTQGHTDNTLNETGKSQAEKAAQSLKNSNIDLIISSNLKRAVETAEIIARATGVEIMIDENLKERNYGEGEGLLREELKAKYESTKTKDHKIPGGESYDELLERAWKSFSEHQKAHVHKNVAVVSHGAVIRALLKQIKNWSWDEMFASEGIKNAQPIKLDISDACTSCGHHFYEQDEDVLDTWFSSALWPFAGLSESDRDKLYPTSVLVTARDILNLWVARMIYSGMEFVGKPPFHTALIHGTVLTKDGKRMSKSLGTGIDPLTIIAVHGADALRFGVMWQSMGQQDIRWADESVIAGRKFANKMWNASRFVRMKWSAKPATQKEIKQKLAKFLARDPKAKKIWADYLAMKKMFEREVADFKLGHALHRVYDFFWHEFCDKTIEEFKSSDDSEVPLFLLALLVEQLKLIHPFMPFVTEHIYAQLPISDKNLLMVEQVL